MKTLDEFRQFYQVTMYPQLTKLEEQRKKTVQKVLTVLAPYSVVVLILAAVFRWHEDAPWWILVIGGVIGYGIYYLMTERYVSDFKQIVIQQIISFVDDSLKYDKSGLIPLSEFQNSRIFLHHADSYDGDDLVSGKVDATSIAFSELHAQYVTRDSKGRRYYHPFFDGLFFIADFNKHFHGVTLVLTDKAEKMLGGLGKMFQKMNISRPEVIRLEDPEFEKFFAIYGTDQVEARYILSTSLMKRISDFRKKTDKKVQLSFVSSKVYIAIPYSKKLFEPKIFHTLLDIAPIQEYFEDLGLALDIVEDLNLNTRIWSKQ